jgi:hypothetical protein
MVHYLFENFLEDQNVYIRNVDYWQKTVKAIVDSKQSMPFSEYLNTDFANGTAFFDGNPIFQAVFEKENKAIRMIQEEPESHEVEISAWLNQIEIKDKTITELVIALELSKESQEIAEYFIKAWIVRNVSTIEMQSHIDNMDKKIAQYAVPPKIKMILQEALSMNSYEKAIIAHYLISSIDKEVDQEWLKLAETKLESYKRA